MFKYRQLEQQLTQQIVEGEFQPGDRLPSLRQYARRHGVSLNTSSRIFTELEERGLVVSREKSGFFVRGQAERRAPKLKQQEAVLVTHDKSDLLLNIHRRAAGPGVIDFGAGLVAPEFLPVVELQRALRRALKRHPEAVSGYGDPAGVGLLREAIAEQMARRMDQPPAPEQLLVTNGCLEAVTLCVRASTQPGQVVAVLTPCYNGLLSLVQKSGRQVLEIPCDSTGPDLDYLEELVKAGAFNCLIFSAVACNPLGFSMSTVAKQRLAGMAKRYRVTCIEDDTFGETAYTRVENSPVFAYPHGGYVHYCSSFSKCLTPGVRIGWIASQKGVDEVLRHKMALNLSSNLLAQHALADYLHSGDFSAHINRLRKNMENATARMHQAVLDYFPEAVGVQKPAGGFFLWLQLPEGQSAMALYERAVQHNITIAPGDLFSLASLHSDKIRLSCAKTWSDDLDKALKKLGALVAQA